MDDDFDLDLDLESWRPKDEGVRVVGQWPKASAANGETLWENATVGEESMAKEEEWSRVLGT